MGTEMNLEMVFVGESSRTEFTLPRSGNLVQFFRCFLNNKVMKTGFYKITSFFKCFNERLTFFILSFGNKSAKYNLYLRQIFKRRQRISTLIHKIKVPQACKIA